MVTAHGGQRSFVGRGVAGEARGGSFVVEGDADGDVGVDGEFGALDGGGAMVGVEVEEVEERLHDFGPRAGPGVVVEGADRAEVGALQAGGEFEAGDGHGRAGLLERGEGAVEVVADVVCAARHRSGREMTGFTELQHEFLGVAIAKVETGGFEH